MSKALLICDLDNTLYDWVGFFVPSFYALVDDVVKNIGCDREELLNDFREVHQANHDSEVPFALLETRTVKQHFPGLPRNKLAEVLDSAFHAFNSKRKETLHLYSGVRETLEILKQKEIRLVAHTESNLYAAVGRLSRLEIIGYFSRVYCRERSPFAHPNPRAAESWEDTLKTHRIKELSHHQRKPNVDVLLEICGDEGFSVDQTAYVGDSLARDMLMAHDARVFSIWAKYGVSHQRDDYEKLVRITHWTHEDVERERSLKGRLEDLKVDLILEKSFGEILQAFSSAQIAAE